MVKKDSFISCGQIKCYKHMICDFIIGRNVSKINITTQCGNNFLKMTTLSESLIGIL